MRRIIKLASLLITCAFATGVAAQENKGFYVGVELGANIVDPHKTSFENSRLEGSSYPYPGSGGGVENVVVGPVPTPPARFGYKQEPSDGIVGIAKVGYRFNKNWRVEGELARREADADKIIALDHNGTDLTAIGTGRFEQDSHFVNVLYDINLKSKIKPFVGAGLGSVRVINDARGISRTGNGALESQSISILSKKFKGAGQLIAGLTWEVTDKVNLDLTYRYMESKDRAYDTTIVRGYNGAVNYELTAQAVSSAPAESYVSYPIRGDYAETYKGSLKGNLRQSSITVGVRYAFGKKSVAPAPLAPYTPETTPTPEPTPEPMPQSLPPLETSSSRAPSQYIVYFAFDRANLSSLALRTIKEAAVASNTYDARQVIVTGHTDTSGSAAYNVALSKRRAVVVSKRLVADGVSPSKVTVTWKGESQLAVPTRDRKPNAANRRSTIDLIY